MGLRKNEFKLFFKDGSWLVVQYNKWDIKLIIETRTIRRSFSFFGQTNVEKYHYYFVNQLKQLLHFDSFKES